MFRLIDILSIEKEAPGTTLIYFGQEIPGISSVFPDVLDYPEWLSSTRDNVSLQNNVLFITANPGNISSVISWFLYLLHTGDLIIPRPLLIGFKHGFINQQIRESWELHLPSREITLCYI